MKGVYDVIFGLGCYDCVVFVDDVFVEELNGVFCVVCVVGVMGDYVDG